MNTLQISQVVEFLKSTGSEGRFRILAYSGAIVERSWGRLAISLDGITVKQSIPVLLNHDSAQIVGYSTKAFTDGKGFFVEGSFSSVTDAGKSARALAGEGFPWQASIGVGPLETVELGAGQNRFVNGHNIDGPCEIWTKSEIFETSLVPLGADSNTSISTFSKNKHTGANNMAKLFQNDPKLKAEFGDFETFQAFQQAESKGLVKIAGKTSPGGPLAKITSDDAKLQWAASPALRSEFFDDFETFKFFCENQHFVKKVGGR